MKRIVIVDTNVLWSTAYKATSDIGQFELASDPNKIAFYAPEYLTREIDRHFDKIVRLSGQSSSEVQTVLDLAYKRITFIPDSDIPFKHYRTALPLVRDVDMDDIAFVALTEFMDEILWTGDSKLYSALKRKVYNKVVNFKELKELLRE